MVHSTAHRWRSLAQAYIYICHTLIRGKRQGSYPFGIHYGVGSMSEPRVPKPEVLYSAITGTPIT
jgi:hypothetical protein